MQTSRLSTSLFLTFSVCTFCFPRQGLTQWYDRFDDGDFEAAPAWSGTDGFWRVVAVAGDQVLQSDGAAVSDTLFLTTPSITIMGTWQFEFSYINGRLSNFNLARIYLISDDNNLSDPIEGYYLQIGTNSRNLRLYRTMSSGDRILMGEHATGLLDASENTLSVTVSRDESLSWHIALGSGETATFKSDINPVITARYFGIWVKHTQTRPADFIFDDFEVFGTDSLPDDPPDPFALPAAGEIVINELFYAPANAQLEFVELFNRSNASFNLCALRFSDNRGIETPVCSAIKEIPPAAFAVLARDSIALKTAFPSFQGVLAAPSPWPTLNNNGDEAILYAEDAVIDRVAYQASWGGNGVSLERKDPAGPSESSTNWSASTAAAGATPAAVNSVFAPDTTPPALLLAELLDPAQLYLVWDEPIRTETLVPSNFEADGMQPDSISHRSDTVSRLFFPAAIASDALTFQAVPDLTGNQSPATVVPLAQVPRLGDLAINEIMYAPRADAFDQQVDQPEYVELYNTSGKLLSLRNLALSGQPDEEMDADTLRSELPYPLLPPESFAVFFSQSGEFTDENSSLAAAFPGIDFTASGILSLPVPSSSLGLLNSGDLVAISDRHGVIDDVLYTGSWHHPILAESQGIALERRSVHVSSAMFANWSSSVDPSGGTPGLPNSISSARPPPAASQSITLTPTTFSPNGDGHDDVLAIGYNLKAPSQVVQVLIFDFSGRAIRRLVTSAITQQQGVFYWDGYDDKGHLLPVGIYIIAVEALDLFEGKRRFFKQPAILALPLK